MRASARGNRSKQLIYMARHNSHNSGLLPLPLDLCAHVHVVVCLVRRQGAEEAKGRDQTGDFVVGLFSVLHKQLGV